MKNEHESVSGSKNESESENENENEIENEIENESVSEGESGSEIENESLSVSENESVTESKSKNEIENESESESENVSHDELVQQIRHPFHLQHPLVLVAKQSNEGLKAHCDGCGELLSAPCFTCIHCNYHLHKQCAEAPLHLYNHPPHSKHSGAGLSLRQRLDLMYHWAGNLYEVIEDEKQCEELYEKSMQSSIIRVIEVNEAGEATKIQHFSHQHCLVLADKMEEEIDRKCDGCMLPISNIFYYCSECPFFLHKTCAELPRIKQHWFRQSNATLNFDSLKNCEFCNQWLSGFFYKFEEILDMCLRCAKVADIIECEGHQHFLFFDFKYREKCNGCGNTCNWLGAFRCGKCRFVLDFGCLTLPHSALHKIDEHKLTLTYHDDKEQSYCDISEQYRDPSLWYYSCSICDTSAHIECVLGQLPFLKDGVTFPSRYYHNHHHDLKFFRKVEGYPECSYCGKLCQEEILKCETSTCNYCPLQKQMPLQSISLKLCGVIYSNEKQQRIYLIKGVHKGFGISFLLL
ncbi:uncharacterized protein [Gossypium hirsutum]|uniref:DC1 domain-containing protein n=1 Tax=Gossypium hirsutum TaxID=3635 RepID=A0ABM3BGP1_GOSHI|nr:uncharacterized protein LOC121226256 [Gossypium hirsutum]